MAHSLSAKKRQRQNVKQRDRNRGRRSQVKTLLRSFTDAITEGDQTKAETAFRAYTKKLDQTAARSVVHKNAAARGKARAQKRLTALKTVAA